MTYLYLIRNPRTHIDPSRNPHEWELSEKGRAEVNTLSDATFWQGVSAIYSSTQNKTFGPAKMIGTRYQIPMTAAPEFSEVDRGLDAFLSTNQFNDLLQKFFTAPTQSIHGWERAVDALARFQHGVSNIAHSHDASESVAVFSHQTILTLYIAHLSGETPTLDRWRSVDFATVATVDLKMMNLIHPFVGAPYTNVPLFPTK